MYCQHMSTRQLLLTKPVSNYHSVVRQWVEQDGITSCRRRWLLTLIRDSQSATVHRATECRRCTWLYSVTRSSRRAVRQQEWTGPSVTWFCQRWLLASAITDCCLLLCLQAVSWSSVKSHLSPPLPAQLYYEHRRCSRSPDPAPSFCQTADHPQHAVALLLFSASSLLPVSTPAHHQYSTADVILNLLSCQLLKTPVSLRTAVPSHCLLSECLINLHLHYINISPTNSESYARLLMPPVCHGRRLYRHRMHASETVRVSESVLQRHLLHAGTYKKSQIKIIHNRRFQYHCLYTAGLALEIDTSIQQVKNFSNTFEKLSITSVNLC